MHRLCALFLLAQIFLLILPSLRHICWCSVFSVQCSMLILFSVNTECSVYCWQTNSSKEANTHKHSTSHTIKKWNEELLIRFMYSKTSLVWNGNGSLKTCSNSVKNASLLKLDPPINICHFNWFNYTESELIWYSTHVKSISIENHK